MNIDEISWPIGHLHSNRFSVSSSLWPGGPMNMDEVAEIGLNIEMEILCFSIYTLATCKNVSARLMLVIN